MSPRARRFASERGFQSAAIVGTGPHGRVLERDVRRAYELAHPARAAGTPAITARTAEGQSPQEHAALASGAAAPSQFTLQSWADASGLLALRRQVIALGTRVPDVTIDHLVCFCVTRALREVPSLNAGIVSSRIVRHQSIHLGFACAAPRGLLVPVVRDADTLSIVQLAHRMTEVAGRAAAGKIAADDLSGGTFTVGSADALGIDTFTPALAAPQVAMLGVGAIQVRPLRAGDALHQVAFVDAIPLSLSCDQQAVDAASAAAFLSRVKQQIEHIEYDLILRGS